MKRAPQLCTDSRPVAAREASVPSKLMLIGEYAVLAGAPALMTSLGPRFQMQLSKRKSPWSTSAVHPFHSESSVSRWISDFSKENHEHDGDELKFFDPHMGRGGFGGSTAEFLLSMALLAEAPEPISAWRTYREYNPRASGADFVAQFYGGSVCFSYSGDSSQVKSYGADSKVRNVLDRVMVFSATHQEGRKLNTTLHLESKDISKVLKQESLVEIIENAVVAFESGDALEFGAHATQYAEALSRLDLEVEASRADRKAFTTLPGVYGAKGVGAGLSDVMIVVTEGSEEVCDQVRMLAQSRNLIEIQSLSSLGSEPGLMLGARHS